MTLALVITRSWAIVQEYRYDAFGETYLKPASGDRQNIDDYTWHLYNTSRWYTSREYDNQIRLYYLRARFYDPKIWRFVSRDPIGIADDVNLYAYVSNNPVCTLIWWVLRKLLLSKQTKVMLGIYMRDQYYLDYGHSSLYFVDWWEEFGLSFYPKENWHSIALETIFVAITDLKRGERVSDPTLVEDMYKVASLAWTWVNWFEMHSTYHYKNKIYDSIFISNSEIETSKIKDEYDFRLNSCVDWYNATLSNCSDKIYDILKEWWFNFKNKPFFNIPGTLYNSIKSSLN